MLSFAFTLSFCICFRVDNHTVTSYFKVQYPRVGLEVIAGAIHASHCTFSSFHKNECNIKYFNSNLIDVYYGTLRKEEKLTCETLINRLVHAIIGPRRNKVEKTRFLDLNLPITNGIVSSKIYDKRDDFNFEIVNFPFLDGDVPRSFSYSIYISQLIHFARVCSNVDDFNNRNLFLTAS